MSFQLCYSCPILSILTRGTWIILTSKEGGYLLSHQSPLESKIFNNSFHSPQIHQSIHQSPTPTEYSTFKIAPFPLSSLTVFSQALSPRLSYLPECSQLHHKRSISHTSELSSHQQLPPHLRKKPMFLKWPALDFSFWAPPACLLLYHCCVLHLTMVI